MVILPHLEEQDQSSERLLERDYFAGFSFHTRCSEFNLATAPLRALIHFARIEVTVPLVRPRIELVGDLNLHLFLLLAPSSLPSR